MSISSHVSQDLNKPFEPLQLLTFKLNTQHYGLPILSIKEVRANDDISDVPSEDAGLIGVFNLRGVVVPLFNIKTILGLDDECDAGYSDNHVIVVINEYIGEEEVLLGIEVDGVTDVLTVNQLEMQAPAIINENVNHEYLDGLFNVEEVMLMKLSCEKLASSLTRTNTQEG